MSDSPAIPQAPVPRTVGAARLSAKRRGTQSVLGEFRTSGAFKVLFPTVSPRLEAILINTGGGLTGGDQLDLTARVDASAQLTLTTQAAERAYRAQSGHARVTAEVNVGENAHLSWLPQELILFNGASLKRSLRIDMAPGATLLMVEPMIFGRTAMGERVENGAFHDRITVTRGGMPLYTDGIRLTGAIDKHLSHRATAQGAAAMASVLYVAPDAEAQRDAIRSLLPDTAGASLLAPDTLTLRMLAGDGFGLRKHLIPLLDRLSRDTLPATWRL